MKLLNPKTENFAHLDEKSRNLMKKTIEFFEAKGKKKLKHDDHERVWYADFLEFVKKEKAFSILMTPSGYGEKDSRWDTSRICDFNEVLGFYGLCYWYTWQVSMLGLGPVWISKNEEIKHKTAKLLADGEIFAFGLSEKEHGADLISSEMKLIPNGDGTYKASGSKFYIGNANKAAIVSTFGKIEGTGEYVFFAVNSGHPKFELIQNVVNLQSYVAEYKLNDYPISDKDILARGRDAWDMALGTIAFCKYNLGWASVGIGTHALYEALNHAANRKLFNQYVTEFPHVKQLFMDAYTRLVAMKVFNLRASDYMRAASPKDRRYLLYNPMVKMKVTMQGEDVMNHLWDVIAAKGLNKDTYFEMAIRDIRGLPKLEGTAHVNMALVIKFINNFLFKADPSVPEIGRMLEPKNDEYLFNQGATSKGFDKIVFHDYNKVLDRLDLPNIRIFREQIAAFVEFMEQTPPDKEQKGDIDYMLAVGDLFTTIVYGTVVVEGALLGMVEKEIVDQIFDFQIRDFTRYASIVLSKTSSTREQGEKCLKMMKKPVNDAARFNRIYEGQILSLKNTYEMNQ